MNEVLRVENLSVGFKDIVVRNVCISAYKGEIIGVLGLNGSGKSTLLGGISGVSKVFEGSVFVNGIEQKNLPVKKRAKYISKYSQRTPIMSGVSARQVIEMGFYAESSVFSSISDREKEKATEYATMFGIEELLENDCQKLSEGQRSLLFLAKTSAQDTPVILLDEPDSSLDYINTHKLFFAMSDLIKTQGKVGIFVLHDPTLALNWCDKIMILHEGEIKNTISAKEISILECQEKLRIIYPEILVSKDNDEFYCRFQKK